MNLLFLVHRIPYPPNKGDKIRSFHELRYLAARHRVHLGCLADRPEDLAHVSVLRDMTASLEVAPLDARAAKLRSLVGLLGTTPLSVRWFESARLRAWVERTVAQERLDAVLLFSSPMAAYVERTALPQVMDFCDVDSDKWRQYAERAPHVLRPVYALEAKRLRTYEERILRRCHAATLVTAREKQLWAGLPADLAAKVHVVPNGVDFEFFAPGALQGAPAREPEALVFTGAMDYYANVDAVTFFAGEVLPRIQAEIPAAKFYIVGNRPTPQVRALERRPGVVVTGFVADVRAYYERAAVCVVPLRIARGIQNKVLEAMAMGRPVLCSTPAAAGLGARVGDEVRVADDPADLAREAIALLRAPGAAAALGEAGRSFVGREYVWDRSMQRLEALLESSRASTGPAVPQPTDAAEPLVVASRI